MNTEPLVYGRDWELTTVEAQAREAAFIQSEGNLGTEET